MAKTKAEGWKAPLAARGLGSGSPPGGKGGGAEEEDAGKPNPAPSPEADAQAAHVARQRGAQPRRTLAEDWASLMLAVRAPVVWSGSIWRMFYLTCLNGFTFFTPLIIKSLLGVSVRGWGRGEAGVAWRLAAAVGDGGDTSPGPCLPSFSASCLMPFPSPSLALPRPPLTRRWCC